MKRLKQENRAPRGALIPPEINKEGLFDLDVDDDIWQDIGLDEATDENNTIPGWLGNENIRQAIKSLLELDRCEEEEIRLSKERCAMQEWMIEEWLCVKKAIEQCGNIHMKYQLQLRAQYLCQLCAIWKAKISHIACFHNMPESWGPSQGEIDNARNLNDDDKEDSLIDNDSEDEEDEFEETEYEMEEELVEAIEQSTFTDAYQSTYINIAGFPILHQSDLFATPTQSRNVSPTKVSQTREGSPRKRNRVYDEEDY